MLTGETYYLSLVSCACKTSRVNLVLQIAFSVIQVLIRPLENTENFEWYVDHNIG
jgi:hypothetical protein